MRLPGPMSLGKWGRGGGGGGAHLTPGGSETPEAEDEVCAKKEVYMYSPLSNSWIYISDVPTPTADAAVAVLSMTEILVIGGLDSDK